MLNSENETIIIYEPEISYSSSYKSSIGNSFEIKNRKGYHHKSIFTPLWKTKFSKTKNLHSKTRSCYSVEKLPDLIIQKFNDTNKKFENLRSKSFNDEEEKESDSSFEKELNHDLTIKYDELIEKLKRSPPQIKNAKHNNEIISLNNKKYFKKQLTFDKENNNIKVQKEFSNPNKIKSLRRKSLHYQEILNNDEKLKSFTNTEIINDFYEYTKRCMEMILELDKSKQEKIKDKVNFNFPKEESFKKIVLFDLDETLTHCIGEIKGDNNKKYKHIVNVTLPSKKKTKIGINIRPHWKETMELIKEHYHIIIYTASHQSYADAVLNYMDPKKIYTKYRLYRNNCVHANVGGRKFYIKDLDIFDKYYDLKNIVIIDNSVLSFAYHLNNGIPIVPYYDLEEDQELNILGYYLLSIYHYDDLREANKIHIRIDYYLEEAKKSMEEEEEDEEDEVIHEDDEENVIQTPIKNKNIILVNEKNDEDKSNNNISESLTNQNIISCKENDNNKRNNIKRSFTINTNIIKKELGALSPQTKIPKRKKTNNEGLNIFDVWKGIRKEMNEKNSRFHQ